ncbi:MAG: hypothetical protein D6795_17695, partial [Deltaproteobacteria bacterium]
MTLQPAHFHLAPLASLPSPGMGGTPLRMPREEGAFPLPRMRREGSEAPCLRSFHDPRDRWEMS